MTDWLRWRLRLAWLRKHEAVLAHRAQVTGDPHLAARAQLVRMGRRQAEGALSHPSTRERSR